MQPQKMKKKQSMETSATDSKAVTKDQRTLSMIEKSGIQKRGDHRLGAKAENLKPWRPQLGVKYDAKSLGHRINDVGSDKLSSNHRKADVTEAMIYKWRIFLPPRSAASTG